jgi:hypothetical protein
LHDFEEGVFQNVWRSLAPLKAIAFTWFSFSRSNLTFSQVLDLEASKSYVSVIMGMKQLDTYSIVMCGNEVGRV